MNPGTSRELRTHAKVVAKWAHTLVHSPDASRIFILDSETTGFESDDEIIELSIINLLGEVVYDQLYKPLGGLKPEAMAVNHITEADVALAPTFLECWPHLFDLLSQAQQIIVYNAEFDSRLLMQTCAMHGIKLHCYVGNRLLAPSRASTHVIQATWSCLMLQYARFYGAPGRYGYGFAWQKLHAACHQLGIDHEEWHCALGDCHASLKVLHALAARHGVSGVAGEEEESEES